MNTQTNLSLCIFLLALPIIANKLIITHLVNPDVRIGRYHSSAREVDPLSRQVATETTLFPLEPLAESSHWLLWLQTEFVIKTQQISSKYRQSSPVSNVFCHLYVCMLIVPMLASIFLCLVCVKYMTNYLNLVTKVKNDQQMHCKISIKQPENSYGWPCWYICNDWH